MRRADDARGAQPARPHCSCARAPPPCRCPCLLLRSEEALFKAGYAHGREAALASVEGEVARAARAAYGALVLEEESARASALDAAVAALEAAQPGGPRGAKPLACGAEEAALLACAPGDGNALCAGPARDYVKCAEAVLSARMRPGAAAAAALH